MLLRDVARLQRHPEEPAEERSALSDHVLPTSLDEQTLTTGLSTSQSAAAIIFNQATRSSVFSLLEKLPPPVTISGVPEETQQKKLNGQYFPVPGETCGGKPVYKSVSTDMWIEFYSQTKSWHFKSEKSRGKKECSMYSQGEETSANTVDAVSSGWKVYNHSSKQWEVQQSVKVQRGTGASHMMIGSQAIPITAAERDLCMPDDAVVLSLVERIDVHMSVLVHMLEGQQEHAADPTEGIAQMLGLLRIMTMNLRALSKDSISTVTSGSSKAGRVASRADMEELRVSSGEGKMLHLFDGNSGTEWQTASGGGPPHWIEIKLTAGFRIESVEVDFRTDDDYRPNAMKLEFYDGLAWRALEDTESIRISSHGKHTLINGIAQTFTGLKLHVLSNRDNGRESRMRALNISITEDGLHQHACAGKVLDVGDTVADPRTTVLEPGDTLGFAIRRPWSRCVCVCVCVCVCYMYVYVLYMYEYMYICMYICIYVYIHLYLGLDTLLPSLFSFIPSFLSCDRMRSLAIKCVLLR